MKQLRNTANVAGGLALGALLLTGCLKTEEFPPEPAILFKSFEQFGDSASLTITFTDGDGDIGLSQGDTLAPFHLGGAYYNNMVLEYHLLEAGTWEFKFAIGARIPVITPTGQNKALEGEIARAIQAIQIPGTPLQPWYNGLSDADAGDTVRFDVRINDRALHTSNMATTGNIVLQ